MAAYYSAEIKSFIADSEDQVMGRITSQAVFDIETTQRHAWVEQIKILKDALAYFPGRGAVFFEYSVPRLGKRIDVVVLIDSVLFVVEFKVGERLFTSAAIDQVWDYALDLKNFVRWKVAGTCSRIAPCTWQSQCDLSGRSASRR